MCSTSPQFRFYDERMDDDLLNSVGFSYINDNFDLVLIVWLSYTTFMTYFSMIILLYKDYKLRYNGCLYNTTFFTFFTTFVYFIQCSWVAFIRLLILYDVYVFLFIVCLSYNIRRLLVALERLFFLYNVYLSYTTFWFIQQRLPCFSYRSKEITLGLAEELKVLVKEV